MANLSTSLGRVASWVLGEGLEIVSDDRPELARTVVVSNHSGFGDIAVGLAFFFRVGKRPSVVVGERLLRRLRVHWLPWHWVDVIVIGRGSAGRRSLLVQGADVLEHGGLVAIMPQGRFRGATSPSADEYGRGASLLAVHAGAAIVPVGAAGVSSLSSLRDWLSIRRRPGQVVICVGDSIVADADRGAEAAHRAMVAGIVESAKCANRRRCLASSAR